MTNKKIDIWFRFIMYFLPFFLMIGYFVYLRTGQVSTTPYTILSSLNALINDIGNISFVSPFYQWFKDNIVNIQLTNFVLLYCFYIVFVEIALLMKNVLVFVIHLANNLIERGAEIGR